MRIFFCSVLSGPVLTKDMQTQPHLSPLPLRSGHLHIKDAQCAETKDVLKNPITLYRIFELLASKRSKKIRDKIIFSSKVAKFAGKIEIDLTLFFLHTRLFLYNSQFLRYFFEGGVGISLVGTWPVYSFCVSKLSSYHGIIT